MDRVFFFVLDREFECDVVVHVHVLERCVVLEHELDVVLLRWDWCDVGAVDEH